LEPERVKELFVFDPIVEIVAPDRLPDNTNPEVPVWNKIVDVPVGDVKLRFALIVFVPPLVFNTEIAALLVLIDALASDSVALLAPDIVQPLLAAELNESPDSERFDDR
jgi:hypothetical protein